MNTCKKNIFWISCIVIWSFLSNHITAQSFVQRKGTQFQLDDQPYYYIGANYWYGGLILLQGKADAKERIRKELDFLKSKGVSNLRVLAAVEGNGQINGVQRVQPALQTAPGKFDASFFKGLDFLLSEMHKRNMKAVLYLSNNWEWSGGFMQYLNWHGKISDADLKKKMNWDEQRDYTSQFYSCQACIVDYLKQVQLIINHKNQVSGIPYKKETAIMAWQIANEPRPMRPRANEGYVAFLKQSSDYIKKLDHQHLVTIGHEGIQAVDDDTILYKRIQALPNVDYLTIHIWPKNWGWFKDETFVNDFPFVVQRTKAYVQAHIKMAEELQKPLVIEEFGLPRDGLQYSINAGTSYRDRYYQSIFEIWKYSQQENGALAGLNFWAFGGMARPIEGQVFWKKGDDYSGDPPMEEQGLNSVFDGDASTWNLIEQYTNRIK